MGIGILGILVVAGALALLVGIGVAVMASRR